MMPTLDVWAVFSVKTEGSYSFIARNSKRRMTWIKEFGCLHEAVEVFGLL